MWGVEMWPGPTGSTGPQVLTLSTPSPLWKTSRHLPLEESVLESNILGLPGASL